MNESKLGNKIAQLLNRSLDDIEQHTLNRLQSARRASLEKNYRVVETLVTAGDSPTIRGENSSYFNAKNLISLVTLLLVLAGVSYWQTLQYGDVNEEIDIMLLADDLPINAYLDNEFDVWLDS
jgi:cytochrome c-type biogenesis protein CcmH/NrfG